MENMNAAQAAELAKKNHEADVYAKIAEALAEGRCGRVFRRFHEELPRREIVERLRAQNYKVSGNDGGDVWIDWC